MPTPRLRIPRSRQLEPLIDELTGSRSSARLTVASVPASHVYVRHIAPEDPDGPDGVVRLPDPDPDTPDRSAQERWWPPVMLHPDWVRDHDFDVFHLQFGFDAWSPEDLRAVVDAVHRSGRPFVYTAHDLRNPHHRTREAHDAQLEVLMEGADAVLTLTRGAALEIATRWGRAAQVLPHPHVVDLATMARVAAEEPRDRTAGFRVGLHVKSLRASMDPLAILPTLVHTVAGLPGGVLVVDGHTDVLERDGARYDEELSTFLHQHQELGLLELHVHDFYSDDELWAYLAGLDVSVLPYRFGTHSGWLEACRDLGTRVVAPTCGHFADQGPVHSYVLEEDRFDASTLEAALLAAYDAGPVAPVPVSERQQQRAEIARSHHQLYGSLT